MPSPPLPSAARSLTGGRATILGTLLGALIIQLVRYTLLANGVPDAAALVVKAALIALAVWLQQQNRVHCMSRAHLVRLVGTYGVLIALAALDPLRLSPLRRFLSLYNVTRFCATTLCSRLSRSACASSS